MVSHSLGFLLLMTATEVFWCRSTISS
jgi:hypothetical protein